MARRVKERLRAMQHLPPSAAQLAYLAALGDKGEAPISMAEASSRIEGLKAALEANRSNAPGKAP